MTELRQMAPDDVRRLPVGGAHGEHAIAAGRDQLLFGHEADPRTALGPF